MILKFLNKYNKETEIAQCITREDVFKKIHNYLETIQFKSYYTILNFENTKRITLDYGSHTEFFIIESEKKENLIKIFQLKED